MCTISRFVICQRCSIFVFKQKTAYEMRISDWSSDVCSSDLQGHGAGRIQARRVRSHLLPEQPRGGGGERLRPRARREDVHEDRLGVVMPVRDRKSVV